MEALNELSPWVDLFVVDSKVYDRINWLEPHRDMRYEALKLLKDGAFLKPDPKVITQKFEVRPHVNKRTGLEAPLMGKIERLAKASKNLQVDANANENNNLSKFI